MSTHRVGHGHLDGGLAAFFRVSEPDGTPNPLVDFGYYKGLEAWDPEIEDPPPSSGEIAWSDIFNVIRDTPGVRKIGDRPLDLTLDGAPTDVPLALREFPVLGTITLYNGDTGAVL